MDSSTTSKKAAFLRTNRTEQTEEEEEERDLSRQKTTRQRHEHIFSNKTHINNGRRIENEENKNEKAEPTK